jgi:putative peptide zinc metalloprotease protein
MAVFNDIDKIKVVAFETSNETQQYLASMGDRHFEVNASVARLIRLLNEEESLSGVAAQYRDANNKQYSEQELEKVFEKVLKPILESSNAAPPKRPFLFSMELISQKAIERFSGILKFLFNKYVAWTLLAIIVILEVFFILNSTLLIDFSDINMYVLLSVILFMLFSSLIHEFGHASACKYFQVDHGGVGFGLYLTFPVFYTDVSNTWKLKRRERLVVNMSGVYFQFILLIPFFLIYLLTYNAIAKYILLTINFSMLLTLNPFFKFDGYWIASDLLGVANLRQRSKESIRYAFYKIRKHKTAQQPYLLQIKKREKIFLIIYTVVVNLFFGFYFFYIIPLFLYHFFSSFPSMVENLIYQFSIGQTPGFALIKPIITQLLFFALIVYLLVRIILPIIKNMKLKTKGNDR